MLNGTITSLSDKWSSAQLSGTVDIRLTQPRTIVRWVMDHAGAGGESVDDGKMNTRDFDLYYKDEAGEWKLAKEVRGNKAHVSGHYTRPSNQGSRLASPCHYGR